MIGPVTLPEVVQWLLDSGYATLVDGQLVVTAKLHREISPPTEIKPQKRRPLAGEILRELWSTFVEEAEVPPLAETNTGSYYLRPYSVGGAVELKKVIETHGINRQKLIDSTRHYYSTAAFKKTLLNYFQTGLWKEVYNTYLDGPFYQPGDNPMEI